MNQMEIKKWLKERAGTFFTAEEVARQTGTNLKSVYAKLSKISQDPDIITKVIDVGVKKKKTTVYCHVTKDKHWKDSLNEFEYVKQQPAVRFNYNSDTITNLMVVKELKELKEVLKNGRSKE
jgi:hypothetical protein